MRKIIGAAMLAGAAVAGTAGVASAEVEVSGNVALTSNYVWRGISQTDDALAVQGGFDVAHDLFYAGAWASNVDFGTDSNGDNYASSELDLYAGFTPTLGPVSLDLGVIGYLYPSSSDADGDLDFYELYAGASIAPADPVELGFTVYWTDDFADADALYAELSGSFALNEMFSLSGAVGHQDIDSPDFFDTGVDAYTTWNVGGTVALHGFELDLRYTDVDEDFADDQVVFTVSRAL